MAVATGRLGGEDPGLGGALSGGRGVADRDGAAVLHRHSDRLDLGPLIDRPGEVLAEQREVDLRHEEGVASDRERIREHEGGTAILAGDGRGAFEGGAVGLAGPGILEAIDDRLGAGERLQLDPERRSDVAADAPVIAARRAEQAEARAARTVGLDGVEVERGQQAEPGRLDR